MSTPKIVEGVKALYKDVLSVMTEAYKSLSNFDKVYNDGKHRDFYQAAFNRNLASADVSEVDKSIFETVNKAIMKAHGYAKADLPIASFIHSARDTADYLYKTYLDKVMPQDLNKDEYARLTDLSEKFSTIAKHSMIEAIVNCRNEKADTNITQTDSPKKVSRTEIDTGRAT